MMRMLMGLQKSQVTDTIKTWGFNSTFDKTKFVLAGYKQFEVVVVGGAGGYSGSATATGYTDTVYQSGGGGGGTLWVKGQLKDLSQTTAVTPGWGGSPGTSTSVAGQAAGAGTTGGSSSFGSVALATGGSGGKGGSASPTFGQVGTGGNGGNGSVPSGGSSPGSGGKAVPGGSGTWVDLNMPTADGKFTILGCGGGGGGGSGQYLRNGSVVTNAQAGGAGASGGTNKFLSPAENGTGSGGVGSGANMATFLGWLPEQGPDYYGGNSTHMNGLVALKIY